MIDTSPSVLWTLALLMIVALASRTTLVLEGLWRKAPTGHVTVLIGFSLQRFHAEILIQMPLAAVVAAIPIFTVFTKWRLASAEAEPSLVISGSHKSECQTDTAAAMHSLVITLIGDHKVKVAKQDHTGGVEPCPSCVK
jgi:hypothetical protein